MADLSKRPFYLNKDQIQWVNSTLSHLTLEQKAGQLFCVMGGDYEMDELCRMVKDSMVGAVLYRPAPAEEIREKYRLLDAAAQVPLLKAANLEEGGAGAVSDGTLFGWPMMVSAAADDEMVEKFAKVCAVEGQSAGINWSFSPVCDLDLNYLNPITNVRTYGSDKDRVIRNTEIYVKTLQRYGVAACAKHYPGDGTDYRDHHLHPTYNSLSAQGWYSSYGEIYRNLIEKDLMSVMVGHIVQPDVAMEINPKLSFADCLPASLSKEMLTGVLREKFQFNGVITTDATIMGGYCMAMERRKAIPTSIMAGCDMIVFNTNLEEDCSYILQGIKDGLLTEERLDEAVTRILALKAKTCRIHEETRPEQTQIQPGKWHRECADKAVTLVKNLCPEVLPVTPEKYGRIRLITLGNDQIPGGSLKTGGSLKMEAEKLLREKGFSVEQYDPGTDDLHGTGSLPGNRLTLYLANYEQASNQTDVRIHWCKKHALDIPRFLNEEDSVFVSFANPYHLQDVPRIKTYINAYTATRDTIAAVIDKITGGSAFKGISPVDPFCGLLDTAI